MPVHCHLLFWLFFQHPLLCRLCLGPFGKGIGLVLLLLRGRWGCGRAWGSRAWGSSGCGRSAPVRAHLKLRVTWLAGLAFLFLVLLLGWPQYLVGLLLFVKRAACTTFVRAPQEAAACCPPLLSREGPFVPPLLSREGCPPAACCPYFCQGIREAPLCPHFCQGKAPC